MIMTHADQTLRLAGKNILPAVGFGTYLIPDDAAADAVSTAVSIGYRHVDTAEGYHNEEGVGAGLRRALVAKGLSRGDIFVTTKLWPGNPAWGDTPKTKETTIASLNASLARLRLDHVDLYLIHAPFCTEHRLEQWAGLVELQQQGKAASIGVSNYSEVHIEEIRAAGLPLPDANQIELHPWSQKPRLGTYLADNGIAVIAYSSLVPLSTWRATGGQDSAKTDAMTAAGAPAISAFRPMAEKYGVSEAQVLLRWALQKGYAVLPKSVNPDRIRQNFDLFSFTLDDADMAGIGMMDRDAAVAWPAGDPSKAA
jgi:2,5-diketo-D-gluconate reductase A